MYATIGRRPTVRQARRLRKRIAAMTAAGPGLIWRAPVGLILLDCRQAVGCTETTALQLLGPLPRRPADRALGAAPRAAALQLLGPEVRDLVSRDRDRVAVTRLRHDLARLLAEGGTPTTVARPLGCARVAV